MLSCSLGLAYKHPRAASCGQLAMQRLQLDLHLHAVWSRHESMQLHWSVSYQVCMYVVELQ